MILEHQPVAAERSWLSPLAQLLPVLAAFAIFLVWAGRSGGYFPHVWYAGGLIFAGLLLVLLAAWPGDLFVGVGRLATIALLALAAFTAWSYLSILWADVQGDAWDGANRTGLYLLIFALFLLWRVPRIAALVLLGVFSIGICLLGVLTLTAASRTADADAYFIGSRFSEPIGYFNGNAALFLLAFWPALFLASRREVPTILRPVFLAAAGLLLQLAVLPQSRGAAISFALVLLVYLALVPGRVRALIFLLPILIAVAAGFTRLLDVGSDDDGQILAAGARSAVVVLAVTAFALVAVGLVLAAVDRRLEIPPRLRPGWRTLACTVAVVAAGAVVLGAADGGARATDAWEQVKSPPRGADSSSHLLSGLQTSRYDLWRVTLNEFRASPLNGIGVENFAAPYARERNSREETLYPHSFPLQVLAQTGIVGAALMLIFLGVALTAAIAALRRQSGLARGATVLGVVIFASWFVHGSIDWFWELPALAGPAIASLALAVSPPEANGERRAKRNWLAPACAGAIVLAVGVSFFFPWLSSRETRFAAAAWRSNPNGAQAALSRARMLNPLTDQPDLIAGSIARRRHDWQAMAGAYERALERNPSSWYSHLQLALARAKQDRLADARSELAVASRLNPREPVLLVVAGWFARSEPVDVDEIAETLLKRHEQTVR